MKVVVYVQIQDLMVCKVHIILQSKCIKDSVFNLHTTFISLTSPKKLSATYCALVMCCKYF